MTVAVALVVSSAAWATEMSVISSFSTGESSVWGVDLRQIGGVTEIHVVAGGNVYRYDTSGTSREQMTGSAFGSIRGLAVSSTWEGAYGTEYLATSDNHGAYRSVWGVNGSPGSLEWGQINGAWSVASGGDISVVSYGNAQSGIWTVSGSTVYRYGYPTWGAAPNATYDLASVLGSGVSLTGVSLGENSDLWLLANDGTIVNVSVSGSGASTTFSVIDTYELASSITSPWGIAYDTASDSLWISNQADNAIYHVAVPEPMTMVLLATGAAIGVIRRR
jgi:hypothetical protein